MSPTKFHNSVHNAPTGYWSIATASQHPATAVSGYKYSAAVALLEGAAQALEENIPVLVTVQEMAAPKPFRSVCGSTHALAVAMLLAPLGVYPSPVGELSLDVRPRGPLPRRSLRADQVEFDENYAAELLDLLSDIAGMIRGRIELALSAGTSLAIGFAPAEPIATTRDE